MHVMFKKMPKKASVEEIEKLEISTPTSFRKATRTEEYMEAAKHLQSAGNGQTPMDMQALIALYSQRSSEELPSVFNAWITEHIPETSLTKASGWGDVEREVVISVSQRKSSGKKSKKEEETSESLLEIRDKDGNLLYSSFPHLLREVEDSSRYFSLKILKHTKDSKKKRKKEEKKTDEAPKYLGIAFVDRDQSSVFVRKLWSLLPSRGNKSEEKPFGEQTETVSWLFLPDELVMQIFKYLGLPDLLRARRTCWRWRMIADDEELYHRLCTQQAYLGAYAKTEGTPSSTLSSEIKSKIEMEYSGSYRIFFIEQWKYWHPSEAEDAHAPTEKELQERYDGKSMMKLGKGDVVSVKLVVVGDRMRQAKTELLVAYANNRPTDPSSVPAVFDNYTVNISSGEGVVELGLWDTSGQESYSRLRPLSYANANVLLVCFSVVDRESFNHVKTEWMPEVRHFMGSNVPILMVGLHVDQRKDPAVLKALREKGEAPVTSAEGIKLAEALGCEHYIECSSQTGENVKRCFDLAIRAVGVSKTKAGSGRCIVC